MVKSKKKMIIGIIANTTKQKVFSVISDLMKTLNENGFDFLLSDDIQKHKK